MGGLKLLTDDSVPRNLAKVPRCSTHKGDHNDKTKERLRSAGASVFASLLRYHGSNQEDGNGDDGGNWLVKPLGGHLVTPENSVMPDKLDRLHDILDRDPEGNDAKRDSKVQQKRDKPILLVPVTNEAEDPPSEESRVSIATLCAITRGHVSFKSLGRLTP